MNLTEPRQSTPSQPPASNEPPSGDYSQPVAYDQQGRPLYAHPLASQPAPQMPQSVYVTHPIDPAPQPLSPEMKQRCEGSCQKYPQLNLSHGEYVISAVKRHPIGLLKIWAMVVLLIIVFMGAMAAFLLGPSDITTLGDANTIKSLALVVVTSIMVLVLIGGMIATYVYNSNRFFLTNESVIQYIQTGLFTRHEQTVSLANIEDASYKQDGILPSMLNYGLIILSTIGEESTYRFNYVSQPKRQIALLNNSVEAFKNSRPMHE